MTGMYTAKNSFNLTLEESIFKTGSFVDDKLHIHIDVATLMWVI